MKLLSPAGPKSCASIGLSVASSSLADQRRRRRRMAMLRLASSMAMALPTSGFAATVTSTWTNLAGNSHWSDPGNWTTQAFPNNGNGGVSDYNVTLGSPAGTLLDVAVTIDNLTVQSNGSLGILDNQTLNIVGGSLANNSTITVNSNSGGDATFLSFGASTVLSGTGAIVLNSAGNVTGRAQITTAGTAALTQAAGSSITGDGQINATLVNSGTVNANVSGGDLLLQTDNMTNNSLFEATGGGRLDIGAITVTQGAAGQIVANASTVNLTGASITGGTLATSAGGIIQSSSGSNLLTSLTNAGTLNILDNSSVHLSTALTNNGTITINSNAGGDATFLIADNNVALSGSGTINLVAAGNVSGRAQLNTAMGATLTQAAGHNITGDGLINATLVNNGTVNANVSGGDLLLQTDNMTNNSLFEATGGGRLDINGITVTQGASGQILANAGTVNLTGSSITGGTLATPAGGVIQSSAGANVLTSVTNAGTFNILDNTSVHLSTALTNNGTITINSNAGGDATFLTADGNVTLNGTGSVNLLAAGNVSGRAQINSAAGATLTVASKQLITGDGLINAGLTNTGTVDANVSGTDLILQVNDKTNSSLMEATNGGTLDFIGTAGPNGSSGSMTLTQGAAGQILANASTVRLLGNVKIVGGTLNTQNFVPQMGSPVIGVVQNAGGSNTLSDVTSNAKLDVLDNTVLHLTGTSFIDNGSVTINANRGGDATLISVDSNLTLEGTGIFNLVAAGNVSGRAQLNTAAMAVLTQPAGHSITGDGLINAALVNQGLVNANVSGADLVLQTNNMTNTGMMQASNGGKLDINGITLTNSGGTITAADGSTLHLGNNATISGGTLSSTGTGSVLTDLGGQATLTGGLTLPAGTSYNIVDNTNTHLASSITNNGTITINSNAGGDATFLTADDNVALSGSGTINLIAAGNVSGRAQLNTAMGATLTQAAGHSITGDGLINATLVNQGLVNANVSGADLVLQTNNMTNTGMMQATNGGRLVINGITITNTGSGQLTAGDGSSVNLQAGASIAGGTLSASGSGVVQNLSGTSTLSSVTVAAGTPFNILDNSAVNAAGTLTNHGVITVNSNSGGDITTLAFAAGASLAGDGALVVNNNGRVSFPKNSPSVNNSLGSLTINGNGKLDLANNGLTIDYGANPSPLATIRTYLASGALVSSLVDASHAVALVDSADGGVPGQPPNSLVLAYAILGDADLEGFVGFDDLVTLARHYGRSNADWGNGDFNNDGNVGFDDLVTLARHYGQTLTATQLAEFSPAFRADVEAAFATVPEPGAILVLALGAGMALPRRRRS